jgi:hypothetical protein
MIAFVTLFLGLVYGPVDVKLSAAPGVERIELYVDGGLVAELAEPWTARLDLGPEIVPRELVAVAKDTEGRRVGEVRQWINRPRPGAEASFVVEKDPNGSGRMARLLWRCVTGSGPKSIRVSFDGRPLEAADPARIPLPAHSAGSAHILVADVDFEDGLSATAVASLGGEKLDEALEELTAVPIRVARGARLPKDGRRGRGRALGGRLRSGGRRPRRPAPSDARKQPRGRREPQQDARWPRPERGEGRGGAGRPPARGALPLRPADPARRPGPGRDRDPLPGLGGLLSG